MDPLHRELMVAFEVHSPERIRAVLDAGLDVRAPVGGKTPVNALLEMYFRSDRFPECLALLLARGGELDDPRLAPVLLDDAVLLATAIARDPQLVHHRTSLVSTFTPLYGASLLHVAAVYGHLSAARVLLEHGAEVDARAAVDACGLNGHTPLFHTVNSNGNRSAPVMHLLLDAGAATNVLVAGITWGRGFEWETTCFDVTPISYAQLGNLPQMQRGEQDIHANVCALLAAAGRPVPSSPNVPNRYLRSASGLAAAET
jgi:ankyrin repeat protein